MTKSRPGARRLPNGRTVTQQRDLDAARAVAPAKCVGDMDAAEFAAFRLARPDHPAVLIRLKRETITTEG